MNTLPSQKDFEARLFLGLSADNKTLVGTFDRVGLKPIRLQPAVKANETTTSLGFDPDKRSLVFYHERSRDVNGSPDYVTSREILAGADLSEIGGVGTLDNGGLAQTVRDGDTIRLNSIVPSPIESGERSLGFVSYVEDPNDNVSHYRLTSPSVGGESDTILIGHPNGSVEFSPPITSPLLVPVANLTSGGAFSGTPNVASGSWRYQLMGTTQVITNSSGSNIEVELAVRYAISAAGSRAGMDATLVNGGADYETQFVEGVSTVKHDGGAGAAAGGRAVWKVILEPGQKCQISFRAWTNAVGTLVCTLGSTDESGGTTTQTVYRPVITLRRIV